MAREYTRYEAQYMVCYNLAAEGYENWEYFIDLDEALDFAKENLGRVFEKKITSGSYNGCVWSTRSEWSF